MKRPKLQASGCVEETGALLVVGDLDFYVTPENVEKLLDDADSMERCVNLNADFLTGRLDPYYHWAIRFSDNGIWEVLDFFANRIVTTQEWHESRGVPSRGV